MWRESRESYIREEGGQIQPTARPISCTGGEISPRAEVKTAESAEEFGVIESGEAQGQRSEEWVGHRSQCGGEAE